MAFPTNPIYKLQKNLKGEVFSVTKHCGTVGTTVNRLHIPFSEGNTAYQEYLKWVAEGNTAEAAD